MSEPSRGQSRKRCQESGRVMEDKEDEGVNSSSLNH